jgi:hypothetical protein
MTLKILVEKDSEPLSDASVSFLPGFSSTAYVLTENASTGYYYSSLLTPLGFIGSYPLIITAEENGSLGRKYLNFSISEDLVVEIFPEKNAYEIGEDISFFGWVTTFQGAARKNLGLAGVLGSYDYNWWVSSQVVTNNSGGFSYFYETTFADPPGTWIFSVNTSDIAGNKGSETAGVNVSLPSKFSYFDVKFNSPLRGATLVRGSELLISVEVSRGGEVITGANVTAITLSGERILLEEKQVGIYEQAYSLPLDAELGDFNLMVEVRKELAGALKGGGEFVTLGVLPLEVNVKSIRPSKTTFSRGETVSFIIAVTYPDGSNVRFANATVKSPQGVLITLHETDENTYEGSYKISLNDSGTWGALITVIDPEGNTGIALLTLFIEKEGVVIPPSQILFAGLVLLVLLVVGYKLFGSRIFNSFLLKRWQARETHLNGMLDATQKKYFERRIDEETYLGLMRKYEGELVGVQSRIKDLRERLGIKKKSVKKGKSKKRKKRKK